jgi:hypothetical protein
MKVGWLEAVWRCVVSRRLGPGFVTGIRAGRDSGKNKNSLALWCAGNPSGCHLIFHQRIDGRGGGRRLSYYRVHRYCTKYGPALKIHLAGIA